MINWEAIEPVLKSLIATLAVDNLPGKPAFQANWSDRNEPTFVSPFYKVKVLLSIRSVVTTGQDQKRTELNEDTNLLETRMVGHRRFVLSVRVEATESAGNFSVRSTAERIRSRLWRDSTIDALDAVGVSLVRTEAVQYLASVRNFRETGAAVLDVVLSTVSNDVVESVQWIETAGVEQVTA
jgi:hypothetical protein